MYAGAPKRVSVLLMQTFCLHRPTDSSQRTAHEFLRYPNPDQSSRVNSGPATSPPTRCALHHEYRPYWLFPPALRLEMSNYRAPTVSDPDDAHSDQTTDTSTERRCLFCHHAPFKVEGRWIRHMEKKHPDEWSAYQEGRPSPAVIFPEPAGRPGFSGLGVHCSDAEDEEEEESHSMFTRILHLLRPLTDLDTRIATTLEINPDDYDSDEAQQEPQTQQLDTARQPPLQDQKQSQLPQSRTIRKHPP